jgi:hypothetical protein
MENLTRYGLYKGAYTVHCNGCFPSGPTPISALQLREDVRKYLQVPDFSKARLSVTCMDTATIPFIAFEKGRYFSESLSNIVI